MIFQMGKTKKKTGNQDRLKKVKETSTFKPHNKKKPKLPKGGKSISGSPLENISAIQENYSLKKRKKSAKLLSKKKKKESKALQDNETRGKSAFNVLKVSEPTCKASESVKEYTERVDHNSSGKKFKPIVNGKQTNVKQNKSREKSAGNSSTAQTVKSDKTSETGNTAVDSESQQKTKSIAKKVQNKGNTAKCKTPQTVSNECSVSKRKRRETDQDKTEGSGEKKFKGREL